MEEYGRRDAEGKAPQWMTPQMPILVAARGGGTCRSGVFVRTGSRRPKKLVSLMLALALEIGGGVAEAGGGRFRGGVASAHARMPNGRNVHLLVRTGPCWKNVEAKEAMFWGARHELPKRIVRSIALWIDGVPVPLVAYFSAYADLGDPRKISVDLSGKSIRVVVRGGSFTERYRAEWRIEPLKTGGYVLAERFVAGGAGRWKRSQMSTYSVIDYDH